MSRDDHTANQNVINMTCGSVPTDDINSYGLLRGFPLQPGDTMIDQDSQGLVHQTNIEDDDEILQHSFHEDDTREEIQDGASNRLQAPNLREHQKC